MFLSRNKKNNVYPCKPCFTYIKVGFKGVKIIKHVFVMSGWQTVCRMQHLILVCTVFLRSVSPNTLGKYCIFLEIHFLHVSLSLFPSHNSWTDIFSGLRFFVCPLCLFYLITTHLYKDFLSYRYM